jgi:hypothetical protein
MRRGREQGEVWCLRLRRVALERPSIGGGGDDASSSGLCNALVRLPGGGLPCGHYDGCAGCFGSGAAAGPTSKHGHQHGPGLKRHSTV